MPKSNSAEVVSAELYKDYSCNYKQLVKDSNMSGITSAEKFLCTRCLGKASGQRSHKKQHWRTTCSGRVNHTKTGRASFEDMHPSKCTELASILIGAPPPSTLIARLMSQLHLWNVSWELATCTPGPPSPLPISNTANFSFWPQSATTLDFSIYICPTTPFPSKRCS
jgi:hypothetical protein